MDLPRVKYSRGKIASCWGLWVGASLGGPRQKDDSNNFEVLQWNAGILNEAKQNSTIMGRMKELTSVQVVSCQ